MSVDTSTDTGDQNTLTFTTTSWDTAQTVTVKAADDDDAVADTAVTLTHAASGGDYASLTGPSVSVTITENDTRGVTLSATDLTVTEGESGTYTVVLDSEPTGDVTVTVGGATGDVSVDTSTDTGDQNTLTFTTTSWSTAQTVTVKAADDDDAVADTAVALTHAASGGDYASLTGPSVSVTITENDTRGVTLSETALTVTEGESGTYTVVLDSEPTGDVTVTVGGATGDVSVDTSADTGDQNTLTFTTTNWDTAQTVTVAAADDDDAVADTAVTLTHAASGGDYASLTGPSVSVTITENDTRGVTLSATALTVKEGESGTYTVLLDSEPTGDVTVTVGGATGDVSVDTSTDTGDQNTLTFTTTSWDTAQTVTVKAADDDDAVADTAVALTHAASGGDYASLTGPSVSVTITENDTRGVTLSKTALTVKEGESGTYTVVLDSEPTGDVTVTVGGATGDVSVDTSTDTGDQNTLTFTTTNWDTAQTVTVAAADDDDAVADTAVTLTHAASGGDYASLTGPSVSVTITENDTAAA